MTSTIEPLVLDLVEWVARAPRPYDETMAVWRTSCPRLPVWEEAVERGLITCASVGNRGMLVTATPNGCRLLQACGRTGGAERSQPWPTTARANTC
jgi:hypothetical protein